jgi:hypothetical protein
MVYVMLLRTAPLREVRSQRAMNGGSTNRKFSNLLDDQFSLLGIRLSTDVKISIIWLTSKLVQDCFPSQTPVKNSTFYTQRGLPPCLT